MQDRSAAVTGPAKSSEAHQSYSMWVFSKVAPTYDRTNRILSFGQDSRWKKELVASLPSVKRPTCIDLACGTGDISLLLLKRYPDARIIGIDLSPDMLAIAINRCGSDPRITFSIQDMDSLGIEAGSADIVTGGYALRNSPDLDSLLGEVSRILKPGGSAAFLDLSNSPLRIVRLCCQLAVTVWGALLGLLFHGRPRLYTYLGENLRKFPPRQVLHFMMKRRGLELMQSRLFLGGAVELSVLRKITEGHNQERSACNNGCFFNVKRCLSFF